MLRSAAVVAAFASAAAALWLVPCLADFATPAKLAAVRVVAIGISLVLGLLVVLHRHVDAWLEARAIAARRRFRGRLRYGPGPPTGEWLRLMAIWCILIASVGVAFVDAEAAVYFAREDGPLEYATAVCYLLAFVANMVFAVGCGRGTLLRWHLVGIALLFFAVGMEEISWGQRLIGFETPAAIGELNVQGELTVHNLWSTSFVVYPALFVTATLLWGLPVLRQFDAVARDRLAAWQFPVAGIRYAVLYTGAVVAYFAIGFRLGIPTPIPITWYGYPRHIDEEYLELVISCMFLSVSLSGWRVRVEPALEIAASAD